MPNLLEIKTFFRKDSPYPPVPKTDAANLLNPKIEGCAAFPLRANADDRGHLIELLSTRNGDAEPAVHVYQVFAHSGSLRGWIYHAKQTDYLVFADGSFQIALFDLRNDSPTAGNLITLFAGSACPVRLTIAPFVAHAVKNIGPFQSSYVNLPDRVYDLQDPDKYRIPHDSPLIDYRLWC